ncbi:hypothetical protein K9M78_06405 [Candidatus Bipolaricaulota bacterium]|nr:hypothetical protein [Candidatus Bipolaricaulota bacterium]
MKNSRIGKHSWLILVLTIAMTAVLLSVVAGTSQTENLKACRGMVFSVEEDFVTQGPEPPDGEPIISDGDLLSSNGTICARHRDLVGMFDVREDVGLDAVDIIDLDFQVRLIAFSTEIDSRHGNFTSGDLLVTNGAVIPNVALTALFQVGYDVGLDALHFVGEPERVIDLMNEVEGFSRERLASNPTLLVEMLKKFDIDILFSVEGTPPMPRKHSFLDGDLLSARRGVVVSGNEDLLPPSVPAGIPNRGVDFGLDAFVSPSRLVEEEMEGVKQGLFSTEILYRGKPKFTDGDALLSGNGIELTNRDLVNPFEPRADFLGLDALSLVSRPPPKEPNIQSMCGADRPVVNFDGGMVAPGGTGTGLYRQNPSTAWPAGRPRRPCGQFVPVDGFLPDSGISRFRVAYRPAGDSIPPVGGASGIQTKWLLKEWRWWPTLGCYYSGRKLETDSSGWMDATKFSKAKDGTLTGCANNELRLAVWDTNNIRGLSGGIDKDGHYVLWLEWEDSNGLHKEPYEHHLQLDNTAPEISDVNNDGVSDVEVRLPDGSTLIPACGQAENVDELQVWSQFSDEYYWKFRLRIRGGEPPTNKWYGPHNYYDPDDGTPGLKNTKDKGTLPSGLKHLRNIYMTDLGEKHFVDCCYGLDLWVWDASIRHSFNRKVVDGIRPLIDHAFITFEAAPKG